ncbi:MAG TPA: EcsC family protein [Pirellulales bacterium]|nr:EcsC family protein [Pirellulales bacterium]
MTRELTSQERQFLTEAARYLERPSLLAKLANVVGKPVELLAQFAPDTVHQAVQTALERAMTLAAATLRSDAATTDAQVIEAEVVGEDFSKWGRRTGFLHSLFVITSGAGGGALGLPGLAIELPVTTALMLRSIASIAREFGERLDDPAARLECLTVFSYGGPTPSDDAMESSYLTTRIGLQETVSHAASVVAKVSADELAAMIRNGTAPRLVQLLAKVASRFNIAVSEKFVAQSIPLIGAVTGAAINAAFLDHFNRVARYHFGIRRLERIYGADAIQGMYRTEARRLAVAE